MGNSSRPSDLVIEMTTAWKVEHEDVTFGSVDEVRSWLMAGKGLFNPITNEYVFHDPEYNTDDTFTTSLIDFEAVTDGDIAAGYSASRDYSVDAMTFCERVVNENGWGDTSRDRLQIYRGLIDAEALWIGNGFEQTGGLPGARDLWSCRTDRITAWISIPRRGESVWKQLEVDLDSPLLTFIRSNGVAVSTCYTMPPDIDPNGREVPHRVPRDGTLPADVRYWAARATIAQVLKDLLPKDNPVLDKDFAKTVLGSKGM